MLYNLGFWFFRWLTGWGDFIQGSCVIITGGFWYPSISLITEKWFLDYCELNNKRN